MKKIRKIMLFICVVFLMQPIVGEAKDFYSKIFADIFKKTVPAIVLITNGFDLFTSSPFPLGKGTGFFVDNKLILTANHVVAKFPDISVQNTEGQKVKVKVIARDLFSDLALLELEEEFSEKVNPLKLSEQMPEIGDIVLAIGHPRGYLWSVTTGIVSGIRMDESLRYFIQTDAAINQGNSGGPLLNLEGEVIGIMDLMVTDATGISFAIPISTVKELLKTVIGKNTEKNGNGQL